MPSLFHSTPYRSSSSSQHSDRLNPPVNLLGGGGGALWRPCSFTPIHSLTGPMGQLFAPHQGGAAVRIPGTHPHLQWNRGLLLVMSCYSLILKCPMSDDIPLLPTYFSIRVPNFACIYQHGPQPKFFPFELWLRSKGMPKLYHLSAIPFRVDTARRTGGSDKSHVIV
jgi:hypothetical protein